MPKNKPLIERFWAKVKKSPDCWEWTGSRNPKGYGHISDDKCRIRGAHRVSWEIHFGPIPDALHVLHNCDNPSCVRPDHLFLGTNLDNVRDRGQKGREGDHQGENNGRAKLIEDDVRRIRSDRRALREIAREYGVSFALIDQIKRRKIWGHV
jgi:hypothetical protein